MLNVSRILLIVLGCCFFEQSVADQATYRYQEVDCWFVRDNTRCSFMTVPEDHDKPKSSVKIRFPVVILGSGENNNDDRIPLVILGGGGPGNSVGLDKESIDYQASIYKDLLEDGDVELVLMEQRGVGTSEPNTACVELINVARRWLQKEPDYKSELEESRNALAQCADRLGDQGFSIKNFNTWQSAADANALRQALGYDKWNILGGSYGVELATIVMTRYPETVAGAVLSAPVESTGFWNLTNTYSQAFETFVRYCESRQECNDKNPQLRKNFASLLDSLAKNTKRTTLIDSSTNRPIRIFLDRDRFLEIAFNALYDSNRYYNLANALDVASRDIDYLLTPFIHDHLFALVDDRFGDGLSMSIHCQEDVTNYTQSSKDASHMFVPGYFANLQEDMKTTCSLLNLKPKTTPAQPTRSIPTLILAGELDPLQAVDHGRYWNEWFERSTLVIFPNQAHYLESDDCTPALIDAFIKNGSIDETTCSNGTYYVEK